MSGTLLGQVKDASGAVVPGATVSLVHIGTGFTRTLATDARGEYTAPSIPTGTYSVSAELQGFRNATVGSVYLGVDQKLRVELTLGALDRAEIIDVAGRDVLAADVGF